jgi:hypothetical protein
MGRIRQCVKDVVQIANQSEDFEQAKKCIEKLFAEEEHRQDLAVAGRVRSLLRRAYDDAPADAKVCLDRLFVWLDCEHPIAQRDAG